MATEGKRRQYENFVDTEIWKEKPAQLNLEGTFVLQWCNWLPWKEKAVFLITMCVLGALLSVPDLVDRTDQTIIQLLWLHRGNMVYYNIPMGTSHPFSYLWWHVTFVHLFVRWLVYGTCSTIWPESVCATHITRPMLWCHLPSGPRRKPSHNRVRQTQQRLLDRLVKSASTEYAAVMKY